MVAGDYEIPEDLLYSREHEWARRLNGRVRVGITDYAAKTLNDVVYVSLPKLGESLAQFTVFGTVESIKAVSELYSPFSGIIVKLNEELNSHPELVNKSPYVEGWILELKPSDYQSERSALLGPADYAKHLATIATSTEHH
ncbi:MAG: glycine cleavage system protein GcvH [Thaumarchaeota archaeon]|nr:glycine cleavage system protein GcvH [Nitrososphaerota archaeon]